MNNIRSFQLSIEAYYKKMENVIEYKENADLNYSWQEIIEQGEGKSYGMEFLLKKTQGNTNGWLAYTLSKSERTFENINNGITFPYKYDRRHDFKIVFIQKLNEKIDFGLTWIFSSGNAVTLALEKYPREVNVDYFTAYNYPNEINYYENKNGYRMPNYHRLDININFYKKLSCFYIFIHYN